MIRNILSVSISAASLVSIVLTTACGTSSTASETASIQKDLGSARQSNLSCKGSLTPVDQLAKELSKQCRLQNAELKAKGLPSCLQDQCSDLVTLAPVQKSLNGVKLLNDSDGNLVGLQVELTTDIKYSAQEKHGLICYAPVLKAEELLGSMASRCK